MSCLYPFFNRTKTKPFLHMMHWYPDIHQYFLSEIINGCWLYTFIHPWGTIRRNPNRALFRATLSINGKIKCSFSVLNDKNEKYNTVIFEENFKTTNHFAMQDPSQDPITKTSLEDSEKNLSSADGKVKILCEIIIRTSENTEFYSNNFRKLLNSKEFSDVASTVDGNCMQIQIY